MRPFALFLACSAVALTTIPIYAAKLEVGQPAPPLTFTQLEQAPPGSKTDWASLRGKVVVLEFWATWCASCIEQIPHLNSLVHSVGSDSVIFIAVDDEEPSITRKFLARFPIEGWLGFDTSKKTIDAYEAETRPKTVVIDAQGRIAAILRPELLIGANLAALSAGRNVTFPTDTLSASLDKAKAEAAAIDKQTDQSGTKPLFNISVLPADPKGSGAMMTPSDDPTQPFKLDVLNAPVSLLISFMGLRLDRIRLRTYPAGLYTLHVAAPSGDEQQFGPAIQLAVASAAHLKITRTNDEEDVWIIQATPDTKTRLEPAALGKGHLCYYDRKTSKLILQRASLDKLAETLEVMVMNAPVLNESGISGNFDAALDLSTRTPEEVGAALEQNMGLTLTRARRKVERLTIDPLRFDAGASEAQRGK